jgi:geranylgeranyl pyrophosphate synthase
VTADWRPAAVDALSAALVRDGVVGDGVVGDGGGDRVVSLMRDAVDHLRRLLATRPPETVAALAVPVAVHRCLGGGALPPSGLLAAAAATYLALDVLDDLMDGDPSALWTDRGDGDVMVGVQVLLVTATQVVGEGAGSGPTTRMTRLYRQMFATVADGQLRSDEPLNVSTTPCEVDSRIGARSGAMLAGFAELAAVAAEGSAAQIASARAFGHELAVARQHLNDVTELVGERTSDLRRRTATMAIALALQGLPSERRGRLVERLEQAAGDPLDRRRLVAEELAPAIGEVCTLIHLQLARARTHAHLLSDGEIGHDDLDRLIEFTAAPLRRRHAR